jgi:hypothetical protein
MGGDLKQGPSESLHEARLHIFCFSDGNRMWSLGARDAVWGGGSSLGEGEGERERLESYVIEGIADPKDEGS